MRGERLEKAKIIAKRRIKRFHLWPENQEWLEREERFLRKTGTRCSCYDCGNPRKYFGEKTYQERRNENAGYDC